MPCARNVRWDDPGVGGERPAHVLGDLHRGIVLAAGRDADDLGRLGGLAAAVQLDRPARILGRPNFNGVWQALNTAYWNLEGHSAEELPGSAGSPGSSSHR